MAHLSFKFTRPLMVLALALLIFMPQIQCQSDAAMIWPPLPPRPIGLYPKDSVDSTLPLRSIDIHATLENGFATVEMSQEYFNPCSKPLETTFLFPKDKDQVFTGFQAITPNQTIIGRVEEKQKARDIYEQNLQQGNTVAYAEINEATHDVLQIDVGNIQPGETLTIKFTYTQPLDIALNTFWRFIILSTLTPRYTPFSNTQTNLPNIQQQAASSISYTWKISVDIIANSQIGTIYSPSHSIISRYGANRTTANVVIDPSIRNLPNKDFVLYYNTDNIHQPSALIEKFDAKQLISTPSEPQNYSENDYIGLVTFFPVLNNFTDDQVLGFLAVPNATLDDINAQSFQQDLQSSRGEFIFIADRSGSMDGARVENLKQALTKLLQILPADSLFNIISFGSTYDLMFPESLPNNPANIALALQNVQQFQANYGGTEILEPIKAAATLPINPRYPRSILLLTDGDVTNANDVIAFVDDNSQFIRYCTIGIGSGVSTYLIETIANVGHCLHEYVQDGQDIGNKALNILEAAISPYLGDFQITFACANPNGNCNINNELIGGPLDFVMNSQNTTNSQTITAVLPQKDKLPYILKNQLFKMWIYFNPAVITGTEQITMTISYTNSFTNQVFTSTVPIVLANAANGVRLHQIGYNDLNNELTLQSILQPSLETAITKTITQNSLKYQILAEPTAFILVVNEVTNGMVVQKPIQVNIPSIASVDYSNTSAGFGMASSMVATRAAPAPMMAIAPMMADGGGGGSFASGKAFAAESAAAPEIMAAPAPQMMSQPSPWIIPPPPSQTQATTDLCGGSWLDDSVIYALSGTPRASSSNTETPTTTSAIVNAPTPTVDNQSATTTVNGAGRRLLQARNEPDDDEEFEGMIVLDFDPNQFADDYPGGTHGLLQSSVVVNHHDEIDNETEIYEWVTRDFIDNAKYGNHLTDSFVMGVFVLFLCFSVFFY